MGQHGQPWRATPSNLTRDNMWASASVMDIAEAWQAGTADPERGLCIFSEAAGSWKRFDGANRTNRPKLTIVYDVPASVPVPDKSSVALGGSLTTNLIVNEEGASHTIAYKLGENTLATYDIGSATSHTYTIPTPAGAYFPSAQTAVLTVEVATTVKRRIQGQRDGGSVTHTSGRCRAHRYMHSHGGRGWRGRPAPRSLMPTCKSRSGVTFALVGTANYGATVDSWQLSIDGKAYTASGGKRKYYPYAYHRERGSALYVHGY